MSTHGEQSLPYPKQQKNTKHLHAQYSAMTNPHIHVRATQMKFFISTINKIHKKREIFDQLNRAASTVLYLLLRLYWTSCCNGTVPTTTVPLNCTVRPSVPLDGGSLVYSSAMKSYNQNPSFWNFLQYVEILYQ